jgi:hypothetical protein
MGTTAMPRPVIGSWLCASFRRCDHDQTFAVGTRFRRGTKRVCLACLVKG